MKKRIAVILALCLLATLAGCKGTITPPDTPTDETLSNVTAQDVSESATTVPEETTTVPETTTAAPATTTEEPDTASYIKPTEQVTYSAEGIPISNAFYSLKLPAEWDGHYLRTTNYNDDVMIMTFREKSSADAGAGGKLFMLSMVPEGEAYDLPAVKKVHTLTGEIGSYTLYAVYPTDVQFTEQTWQQYDAMAQQINNILKTLEPGIGFRFDD